MDSSTADSRRHSGTSRKFKLDELNISPTDVAAQRIPPTRTGHYWLKELEEIRAELVSVTKDAFTHWAAQLSFKEEGVARREATVAMTRLRARGKQVGHRGKNPEPIIPDFLKQVLAYIRDNWSKVFDAQNVGGQIQAV